MSKEKVATRKSKGKSSKSIVIQSPPKKRAGAEAPAPADQLRESNRPRMPITPPANRNSTVNSKNGVETIVEQAATTDSKISVKPPVRIVKKSVMFVVGAGVGGSERATIQGYIPHYLLSSSNKIIYFPNEDENAQRKEQI